MVRKWLLAAVLAAAAVFCHSEESLPKGYRNISFGMSVSTVKDELKKDKSFGYRGDRDVSLLPGENRTLIETDTTRTAPDSFLEKCWFQFYEDKLYTITINFRQSKLDHYSIYSSLEKKYGKPSFLSPEKIQWESDDTIMSLERPLVIKYTDKAVLEELRSKVRVEKTNEEKNRQDFLDSL